MIIYVWRGLGWLYKEDLQFDSTANQLPPWDLEIDLNEYTKKTKKDISRITSEEYLGDKL